MRINQSGKWCAIVSYLIGGFAPKSMVQKEFTQGYQQLWILEEDVPKGLGFRLWWRSLGADTRKNVENHVWENEGGFY